MKYYRVTAYTPYCGEETTDFIATEDEQKLQEFAQTLCEDNAAEWEPAWCEHYDEGYETEEEFQDYYYSGCGTRIEEITEAEYKEETKPVWPFELIKEGPGWDA